MDWQIFIGSSTDSQPYARDIQTIINDDKNNNVRVTGWWSAKAFPIGHFTLESLQGVVRTHNCALLVASPDDVLIRNDKPSSQVRDNVIFEYGLMVGAYDRGRVAFALLPDDNGNYARIPSDLQGVTTLHLKHAQSGVAFQNLNQKDVLAWVAQLQRLPAAPAERFPLLLQATDELSQVADTSPGAVPTLDRFAADMVRATGKQFKNRSFGFGDMYSSLLKRNLRNANSIYALDVLGPSAWVGSQSFRYLSLQLWQYLRANTIEGMIHLRVSNELGQAISSSIERAKSPPFKSARQLDSSHTDFDGQKQMKWKQEKPTTEYARILLWTSDELLSPVAESVIAIHEAFHVPLFFLEVEESDRRRDRDYLLFQEEDTKHVFGFVSRRSRSFRDPEPIDNDPQAKENAPLANQSVAHFYELLSNQQLMFALDARYHLAQE